MTVLNPFAAGSALTTYYSCCFHADLLPDCARETDAPASLCLPGDEGDDAESSKDAPAKEEETQAEGS